LSAVVYPDPNYSITHILRCLFLIHLDCVERLLMDIHPPARRPHKSPAHTVKDPRNRPQRLVPYPTSKPSSEPHILQQIPSPSTPREIFFCCFPPSTSAVVPARSAGPRIMQIPALLGKPFSPILFTILPPGQSIRHRAGLTHPSAVAECSS